jgi:hypothetical protein
MQRATERRQQATGRRAAHPPQKLPHGIGDHMPKQIRPFGHEHAARKGGQVLSCVVGVVKCPAYGGEKRRDHAHEMRGV